MKKVILLVLVLAFFLTKKVVNADFIFGTPTNLGPNINSSSREQGPSISADGLECYFMSNRPGGHGDWDIWVSKRETLNDAWGTPVNIGPTVNSASREGQPEISADGLSMIFDSTRPAGHGYSDLWMTKRTTKDDGWEEPINLGPIINTSDNEWDVSFSANGLELYFCRSTSTGPLVANVWVATRATKNDPWAEPTRLTINSSAVDSNPHILPDGLTLLFASTRSGGYGRRDIWITTRQTKNSNWLEPVNLGPPLNSQYRDDAPDISPDGSMLYFHSDRTGGSGDRDLWQVSIEPVVDLNSDGIVDSTDMCIIVDNWDTDDQLCDIGPMPWGDGIVDVQDLIVLAEHLFEEIPPDE